MSSGTTVRNTVRLSLLAATENVSIVAPVLARHLSISHKQAVNLLGRGPGVLSAGLPRKTGDRLLTVLRAMGLRVALASTDAAQDVAHFDVSILPKASGEVDIIKLAETLGLDPETVRQALYRPGGLVRRAQSLEDVARLRRVLRRMTGVQIAQSQVGTAIYDIFCPVQLSLTDRAAIKGHLQLIGLKGCAFTGALACGLDRAMLDHVMARFGQTGIIGIDRAFQRFDLYVTGVGEMPVAELADFLATRRNGSGRFAPNSALTRCRIEHGLGPQVARQFATDYASIGIETAIALSQSDGGSFVATSENA